MCRYYFFASSIYISDLYETFSWNANLLIISNIWTALEKQEKPENLKMQWNVLTDRILNHFCKHLKNHCRFLCLPEQIADFQTENYLAFTLFITLKN